MGGKSICRGRMIAGILLGDGERVVVGDGSCSLKDSMVESDVSN